MVNKSDLAKNEDQDFDLNEVLSSYLRKWHYYVFCLLLLLPLAYVINFFSTPIYYFESKLLINEKESNTILTEGFLPDLNILMSSKSVDNEQEILLSRDLIRRVIEELKLNIDYYQIGDFKRRKVFRERPFTVIFDSLPVQAYYSSYEVNIISKREYNLRIQDPKFGIYNYSSNHWFGEKISIADMQFQINYEKHGMLENIPVIDKSNAKYAFYINFTEDLIDYYRNKLSVVRTGLNSDVLLLRFEEKAPDIGLIFLRKLINVYEYLMLEEKQKIASKLFNFIDNRLQMNFADLIELEKEIENYKRTRHVSHIDNEANYILEGIKKFEIELSDAQSQLNMVNHSLKVIVRGTSVSEISVPTMMLGIEDQLLNSIVLQLNLAERKLASTLRTVQKDNPIIAEIESEIRDLKKSLSKNLMNHQTQLGIAVSDIELRIKKYKDELDLLTGKTKDLVGLERRRNIKEELYLFLLKKREQAAMAMASEMIDSRQIEEPFTAGIFNKPKKSVVYLCAVLLALFLPTLVITLVQIFSDKINSLHYITRNTSAPVIGRISKNSRNDFIVVGEGINTPIAEEFKTIKLNLQFINDHKIILITSCVSGEGKTFNCINLATTFAVSGYKTCILELELRKPKISICLGMERSLGVSDFLSGQAVYDDILQHTKVSPNLDFISAGSLPPNPSELLANTRLSELLNVLKERYDKIIIDSPPIVMVSDGYLLGEKVDTTLFVLRHNFTRKKRLNFVQELYDNQRFKNLLILFNASKESSSGYGYYYYSDDDNNLMRRAKRKLRYLKSLFSPKSLLNRN